MSLVAMVLADRVERFTRFYDWWIHLITFGRATIVRRAVLRYVRPGETVLDVGCGTGTLAIAAARQGTSVVGVDRSRRMLELAHEKAARAGVTVDFRVGQAPILPVTRERFDVATATFALSELSRDEALLTVRAMAEVVRPGGRVIIADEVPPRNPLFWLFGELQRLLFGVIAFALLQELAPTHRHPWRALLEEAGLVVHREDCFQEGALAVVVAERPATLPDLRRDIVPLAVVLPRGIARAVLSLSAWFALPIPVRAGVYQLGAPDREAPVVLTSNFLATVDAVCHALDGLSGFIIVEDTSGWNVWCASDAGLFTAEKAAALMRLYGLDQRVTPKRVVIPRLGGRIRARLAQITGWDVVTGPIEARDLPAFLREPEVTPAMRSLDRTYRLPERLRVGALTVVQLPVFLAPLRFLPASLRAAVWRFALVASAVLAVFHYWLPGQTGIVKGLILGLAVSGTILVRNPRRWAAAVAVTLSAPLIGWIYQSSSPVVYWKRIWK
ncbi:MAG TPA: methyltransferase domain-containing protein [Chloroflexota bacterium]|nr:methyltransferase domain-containing protein [Chloroflexota bacterium]